MLIQSRFLAAASFTQLTPTILVAGADGAHTFTVDVYDLSTATVVCVSAALSCSQPAGTFGVACAASVANTDIVQLRINDGSCLTTAPILNVAAEYQ